MGKHFSEDSWVKIPALVHLSRLGYQYLSTKEIRTQVHKSTNIFPPSLLKALNKLNEKHPAAPLGDTDMNFILSQLESLLLSDDLGEAFYHALVRGLDYRGELLYLADFQQPDRNIFQMVTEMPCEKDGDSFRPDITLYLNGLPLAFVEVKIPDNKEGIQAERRRMQKRHENPKFRAFLNAAQVTVFSNNSEYDEREAVPLSGAFYSTDGNDFFAHFREEEKAYLALHLAPLNQQVENAILKDTNLAAIKGTPAYQTNKSPDSPTNRLLSSLFLPERFLFFLRYGLCYVKQVNKEGVTETEKHIMRYQQFFAACALREKAASENASMGELAAEAYANYPGPHGGLIWHTQGSGKTELSYYAAFILQDYYATLGIDAKFYFIVDRIDLLEQAAREFTSRGLAVTRMQDKDDFIKSLQNPGRGKGKTSMNVVNIQKFSDSAIAQAPEYNISIQRIYFIDEAHRDFKANGRFLTWLVNSDRSALKFALTGTPLLGKAKSTSIFGNYLHRYYYNQSIADGFTLRLVREGIRTEYRLKLNAILTALEQQVPKGSLKAKEITASPEYVTALAEYIEEDFLGFRILTQEATTGHLPVGGMVVCASTEQAVALNEELQRRGVLKSAAILSTIGQDKGEQKDLIRAYQEGTLDILVVYNMLLTGFNAPRLKRLYLGRLIKEHNLLQALTRVNRPYAALRYGYVVDFADIRAEFDKTNRAYLEELRAEIGEDFSSYDGIFKTAEEIEQDLSSIADKLFAYTTDNPEVFRQEIQQIADLKELRELNHALQQYKELYNLSSLLAYKELQESIDLQAVNDLAKITARRLDLLNEQKKAENTEDMSALLKAAASQLEFHFKKIATDELKIAADENVKERNKTANEFRRNADQKDQEYLKLRDELKRILSAKNIEEMTVAEMQEQDEKLAAIRTRMERLNTRNTALAGKYEGDMKYMRLHKHFAQNNLLRETELHKLLLSVKSVMDNQLHTSTAFLDNEAYARQFLTTSLQPLLAPYLAKGARPIMDFMASLSHGIYEEYARERK